MNMEYVAPPPPPPPQPVEPEPTPEPTPEPVPQPAPVEPEPTEPEPIQTVLHDGDKVELATDVDEDAFESFTTFQSTQFFSVEFELEDEQVVEEDPDLAERSEKELESWFESQNDGVNMPNWVLLLICSLLVLVVVCGVLICLSIRKNNKRTLGENERAIMRELAHLEKEDEEVNIAELEKYEDKPHKFLIASDEKAMVGKVKETSKGNEKKDKTKNQDEDQTNN